MARGRPPPQAPGASPDARFPKPEGRTRASGPCGRGGPRPDLTPSMKWFPPIDEKGPPAEGASSGRMNVRMPSMTTAIEQPIPIDTPGEYARALLHRLGDRDPIEVLEGLGAAARELFDGLPDDVIRRP